MRKADIAEWLLSLTTTAERAAATAGDLTQEAAGRRLWFWWSLLRTTASLAWRSFTEEPLKTAGVGFAAWLLVTVFGTFLVNLVIWVVLNVIASRGIPLDREVTVLLSANVTIIICYFRTGIFLARHSPGKELAALLMFIVVHILSWTAVRSALPAEAMRLDLVLTILGPLIFFTMLLSLLAGIDQGRKKTTYAQS